MHILKTIQNKTKRKGLILNRPRSHKHSECSYRFWTMILQLDRLRDIVPNLARDVAALSNYNNDSMYHIASFDGYWNIKENRPFADIQFSGVLHNLLSTLPSMGKLQTKLSRSFTPDIIRFSNARAWHSFKNSSLFRV